MLKSKRVSDSATTMTYLMTPQHANISGSVYGGAILSLVDNIAYVAACKHSNKRCVTASFDRVDFLKPIKIGQVVTLLASVNYVGKTSMEVGVKVLAEDLKNGKTEHTNSCYVTMVAVDNKMKPVKIPKITPETPEEKRRYRDAEERREHRLKHTENKI